MEYNNDDVILIEEIEDDDDKEPVVTVFRERDGTIGFASTRDPASTALILSKVVTYIIESNT